LTTVRLANLVQLNPPCRRFEALDSDEPVSFLPMEGMWPDALELSERIKDEVEVGYTRFEEGDLLLPKISPTFSHGRSAVASGLRAGIGTGTTELHVLRPGPAVAARWLFYVTKSSPFLQEGGATQYGVAGQKRISVDWLKNYRVPHLPLAEQNRVVQYLDTETSRIDRLIDEETGLRQLVVDRRMAEIDRLIERGGAAEGLMPLASQWLDALPPGWQWMPLKHCVDKVTVGIVVNPSHYYEDDGVPVLRGLNIRPGRVNQDDLVFMSATSNDYHAKSRLDEGDVVVVRTGDAGSAAVVPEWAVGGNIVDLLLIRPGPRMRSKFLELLINSRLVQRQVVDGSVGALQSHFNTSALSNVMVVVPPLPEQDRVLRHLTSHLDRYDRLIAETDLAVARLREHRLALITAAVGGGLDATGRAA